MVEFAWQATLRWFCEAVGQQSSKSLLPGVLAVTGVSLLFYFCFVGRACENTNDLRFGIIAKEFTLIYFSPLPGF